MNRRRFLFEGAVMGLAALAPAVAFSQEQLAEPFRRVGPNREEAGSILVFFQFSCPACKASHNLLDHWGRSLPPTLRFQFVPVVYPDLGVIASARAWIAASRLGREAQSAFERAAYARIQSSRENPIEPATWSRVARDAGIPHETYARAWEAVRREDVEVLGDLFLRSDIRETPSVLLDGRYVVTPDNVQGDERLFVQLLNGVASAVLEGRSL